MKCRASSAGFTIVEMMVVLAVTGALFVSIAATLAGRQQSNEFTQSIQDVRSYIQQTMTTVQSGYYTSKGDFTCDTSVPGSLQIRSGGQALGSQGGCIFLGNVVQVHANDLVVYPIAGLREATSLDSSKATPIVSSGNPPAVDESSTYYLRNGLSAVKVVYNNGSDSDIGAFGILTPTGNEVTSSQTNAANQNINLFALKGTDTALSGSAERTAITSSLAGNYVENPSGAVKICFRSGSTGEYGLVTIGKSSQKLYVSLDIMKISGNPGCNL